MNNQTTSWRIFALIATMLIVLWVGFFPPDTTEPLYTFLQVTLQSTYVANYDADPLPTRPGVNIGIVLETIKETEPDIDETALEARQAAFEASLLTPIATVNGKDHEQLQ